MPLGLKKFVKLDKIKTETMYKSMFTDKKNRQGKIRFVLLQEIGKILVDVEAGEKDIHYAIEKGIGHFQ